MLAVYINERAAQIDLVTMVTGKNEKTPSPRATYYLWRKKRHTEDATHCAKETRPPRIFSCDAPTLILFAPNLISPTLAAMIKTYLY